MYSTSRKFQKKNPIQGHEDLFFCSSYSEIFYELKANNIEVSSTPS